MSTQNTTVAESPTFSIGRATLLVHDLDETVRFYRDAFEFATLFDGEVAPGLRTVHIGPHGQRGAGLWLLRATSDAGHARVGTQTAPEPALVLYVKDLATQLQRLDALDVRVVKPLMSNDGASFAHVLDNCGNEIVLVEFATHDAEPDAAYKLVETTSAE